MSVFRFCNMMIFCDSPFVWSQTVNAGPLTAVCKVSADEFVVTGFCISDNLLLFNSSGV